MKKARKGWHSAGDVLGYGDGRKTTVGERLEYKDRHQPTTPRPPTLCQPGMHATGRLEYALRYVRPSYAQMPATTRIYLCRVLVEEVTGADNKKFVGRYRTILWKRRIPKKLWANKSLQHKYTHTWTRKGVAAVRAWAEANGAL